MAYTQKQEVEVDAEAIFPMSPTSQSLHSSIISLTILGIVELETQLEEYAATKVVREVFLPLNARFSAVIHKDDKGVPSWKKVQVFVEDHIKVPTFPIGLTTVEYDVKSKEYIASLAGEPLPANQPLWEIHLIKYPTMNGAMSMVFKFSHALGDGYSIMSVLFSAFRRADDPSLPLTLPNISTTITGAKKSLSGYVSMFINTFYDLTFNILKGSVLEDSKNAIRSATLGLEFEPIAITDVSVSLERLKFIKSRVGGTLNDVVTGAIYYMIHLYMESKGDISSERKMNLLVMFNTRMLRYKSIDEMIKADLYGHNVSILVAPIPSFSGDKNVNVDPLDFVTKAKEIMNKKKNSMFPYLANPISNALRSIRGPKGFSKYVHASFHNTTTTITNLVGPVEKMAMAGHPVGGLSFVVTGIPQSLVFTVVSCTGQLRVTATMEKNLIDSQLFKSCMEQAFKKIYAASASASASASTSSRVGAP